MIVLGDLNAHIESMNTKVKGAHKGFGNGGSNGSNLDFATSYHFMIINIHFGKSI